MIAVKSMGNIKPKNEWLHTVNWDLVVFDEYHFGAWRDTAKELFEGEEEAVVKKELKYFADLEDVNEDLAVLSEKEVEFLPITTKASSTSPAHHSRRLLRASLSKSKSSTGLTLTNNAPRKILPSRIQASGTLLVHCRRCVS
jgi:hypothetical protein